MSNPFLKTTTSLCLALSLVQPLPGVAWAQSPAPDCVPGSKDCPVIPPKNRGDKAPAARPRGSAQTDGAEAPQRENRTQPPRVAPPPAPQNRSQDQNQHQIQRQFQQPAPTLKPRTNDQVSPQIRNQAQPPVQPRQPFVAPPPSTGQQNRSQEQNQIRRPLLVPNPPVVKPRTTAPTAPQYRNPPQPPVRNQQPLAVPPATGQQNRNQQQIQQQNQIQRETRQPTVVQPTVPRRVAPKPPLAAQVPLGTFSPSGTTSSIVIAPTDVRPSHENRFVPRHSDGLTDLEKFGLILLGAAIIGSILSDGQTVILNSGDRVVARDPYGSYHVYHDDNVLLRRPGSRITTERFHDGSILTRVLYLSGIIIFTISTYDGRMLRRWVQYPHRPTVVLFDDTRVLPAPVIAQLPPRSPVNVVYTAQTGADLLHAALMARPLQPVGRYFNLDQIRSIPEVRYLVPEVEIASFDFASGSAAINPDQAGTLATLARVMTEMIAQNPAEMFLIEGHSDGVGDRAMNLALSDARSEAMAAALTEYFGVPPQNMVTQGYGESDHKEQTSGPSEVNRRVILRRITELLAPTAE